MAPSTPKSNREDACALDDDGNLMSASKIDFVHSPSSQALCLQATGSPGDREDAGPSSKVQKTPNRRSSRVTFNSAKKADRNNVSVILGNTDPFEDPEALKRIHAATASPSSNRQSSSRKKPNANPRESQR